MFMLGVGAPVLPTAPLATPRVLCFFVKPWHGVGWGGVGMLTFFELAHILDATLLCLSCVHKHVDVTHLMHINMPRSFLSNILDATPVMGWGEYVNIL